jgi:hypothetical protein
VSGLRNKDPFELERMEREDPDCVRGILEEHSGKDAMSCPICAIAQEYRALRKDVAELVKAAQAVVDVGFRTHDCEHGDAISALEEALKPFTREDKP